MQYLYVNFKFFGIFLFGLSTLLQANSVDILKCQQSRQQYVKAETKWSALYTEESFLHDELKRLQNISQDAKIIGDVLDIASKLLGSDAKLSKTETTTLNMRIPRDRGILYEDGSFAITGHKAKSLKESQEILAHILKWSSDGVTQMQGNLSYIHPQISEFRTKVKNLQSTITEVCTEDMLLEATKIAQETSNDTTIAKRFAEREQQRYEEVSNRRWGEIERSWVNRYYNTCRFRPCHIGVPIPY